MKQMWRFSLADLFVAVVIAAGLLITNLVQRDVGSGLQILLQGWPLPAATNHELSGMTIHWSGLLVDVITGVALVVGGTTVFGKLLRWFILPRESRTRHEVVR